MKIEKITKLKNGKYKIKLDSFEFITYDDIIIKRNLLYNNNIDSELFRVISLETEYYEIYNKVLKFCMKKVRSEEETRSYLDKTDTKDIDKEKIISKLKRINLINDKVYASSYINDKIYLSKDSINKIRQDLLNSNIDSNIIDTELNKIDVDELDKLEKLIIKRIHSNRRYSNVMLKNKIVNEMINLGYNYDDIISIFNKNVKDTYDILIKEYNKLYNRYYNKYKDKNLELYIKNKLYTKGFNYDDIKKEDLH